MANMKRVEKRLENVENWLKQFEASAGPKQTMDNMNWLVGQSRLLGERLQQAEGAVNQLNDALQKNSEIVQTFMEEQDCVMDWQGYLAKLEAEAQEEDAIQESSTEEVSVQEQTEDSA
tara:strand:- start:1503 stop:1856 length:354 start_codon:yes stop_codon:yes gene_type:complete